MAVLQEKILISALTRWSVVVVPSVFIASLLYNYVYFRGLNVAFTDVPFTLSDLSSSFLVWLPSAIVIFIVFAALHTVILKDVNIFDINYEGWFARVLVFGMAIMVITMLIFGDFDNVFVHIAMVLYSVAFIAFVCTYLLDALVDRNNLDEIYQQMLSFSVVYLFVFFAYLAFSGFADAYRDRHLMSNDDMVWISPTDEKIQTNIVRVLSSGPIIETIDEDVAFIPWRSINDIHYGKHSRQFKGLYCSLLVNCAD